jgi:hypothetical protein
VGSGAPPGPAGSEGRRQLSLWRFADIVTDSPEGIDGLATSSSAPGAAASGRGPAAASPIDLLAEHEEGTDEQRARGHSSSDAASSGHVGGEGVQGLVIDLLAEDDLAAASSDAVGAYVSRITCLSFPC